MSIKYAKNEGSCLAEALAAIANDSGFRPGTQKVTPVAGMGVPMFRDFIAEFE